MIRRLKLSIDKFVWGDALRRYAWPGRIFTGVLRNCYAVIRDIAGGQLTLRAMSLVYTTLLSVVPLIAFSFAVLKGFGYHKQLQAQLYTFLEPLGQKGHEITDQVMTLVNNVNGSVLGGIGLAFFVYTAISMVQKVEEAFNYVWYVTKPRSFAKRFVEYIAVLVIGMLTLAIVFGTIASVSDDELFLWMQESPFFGPLFTATTRLTPYLVVIALFTFLYIFMPNTSVRFRSALVGGVTGGILWATASILFATFVVNSVRTQSVYASFAVVIIALLWIYLNWLILLIGAQVAFYHQNPAYLRIGRREPQLSNEMRERLALNIMYQVGVEFSQPGDGVNLRTLSRQLRIPSITLAPIANVLETEGLLTSKEDESLLPGRDMAKIALTDIVATVRRKGETGSHRTPNWDAAVASVTNLLDEAIAEQLGSRTLAELVSDGEKNDPRPQ